ncbi:PA0069 family radical SAM protein [Longimicrobium sp.]|uniref:PA0069 family radical SAM protein n=1 Tax=Longimicrobium sp. TaxID=2029185 RepID=UPI002E2FECBB|nr:PA0069 family radical SAM protein [Longimicrobium sp.]HEX6038476.1 PA0069 family radical SAM protein [Longimicrobium sp.]
MQQLVQLRGRGAAQNPRNRFVDTEHVADGDWLDTLDDDEPGPRTEFLRDHTRGIIARNDSPDIPFQTSVNPYRGCEHGCIYCFARPTHEYLGFSAGLDFETRILVKHEAAELLRRELASPKWVPSPIAMSGVTDPYQPVERKLGITRACLEVLAEFRNPVAMVTKNHLVTRDIDLLGELAAHGAAVVNISVTSLNEKLQRVMEPRASTPARRLEAIHKLSEAGIPVRVLVAPVVPGLTDHEMPAILAAAAQAGATAASYIPLRLPHGLKGLFEDWLETHFPDRRAKVLNRIREMRGGKLYDSEWGTRMRGEGVFADQYEAMFGAVCRKHGLTRDFPPLSTSAFRRVHDRAGQMGLFD